MLRKLHGLIHNQMKRGDYYIPKNCKNWEGSGRNIFLYIYPHSAG